MRLRRRRPTPEETIRRTLADPVTRGLLADPKVRALVEADLRQRADRIAADARRMTGPTGPRRPGPELPPLRVSSERADRPKELE